MRVALVSIDPISIGCTRPTRNLGIHQLAAFARQHDTIRGRAEIHCFDWTLPNFGGKAGPGPDTHRLARRLVDEAYEIVGFSTKIWNFHHVRSIARLVKRARPGTVVLCGGYQIEGDRFPRLMLDQDEPFDFLITGEGEEAFVRLLDALAGSSGLLDCPALWLRRSDGRPRLTGPKILADLERLPSSFEEGPDDDFSGRLVILEASRGCPFRCHFCEWAVTPSRLFPLERVCRELDHVLAHGGNRIAYADGTFNLDRKRRFHPLMEYLIDRQRHYAAKFGREYARTGQIGLELRPELITDRCAELLEEMASLFGDTFYEFGLQTTGEQAGRLVGRPYDERKWMSALERLGPESRGRTGISLIVDLPANTLEAIADSNRVALKLGAQTNSFCLYVLPGTELEKQAEALGLEFDPYPAHRVTRWLDRTREDIHELVAFGFLCTFLANMLPRFWIELEGIDPSDLHFTSIMLRFHRWLAKEGLTEEVYGHLTAMADFYGEDETSPELHAHRRWVASQVPLVFARFTGTDDFLDPVALDAATRAEVHRRLAPHLDLWMLNLTLTQVGLDPI